MSSKSQAPPLYIWLLLVIAFAGLQSVLYYYPEKLFPQEERQDDTISLQERRTLAQFGVIKPHYLNQHLRNRDAYQVVVIGSSITNNSVACSDILLHESETLLGEKIIVTKIFSPGRPLKALVENGGLTELLVANKPDLVLLEADIVTFGFRPFKVNRKYEKGQRFKQRVIGKGLLPVLLAKRIELLRVLQQNRLNVMAGIQNQQLQTAPPFTSEPCGNMIVSPQLGDTLNFAIRKRFAIPFDHQTYTQRFIQELQQAGVDIAILHHPRSAQLEKRYAETPEAEELNQLINQFQQTFNIPYWYCPLKFPYRYYRDKAHMNHVGRQKYGRWLLQQIHQHARNSSSRI